MTLNKNDGMNQVQFRRLEKIAALFNGLNTDLICKEEQQIVDILERMDLIETDKSVFYLI